jgi:hypothetical protein
VLSAAAHLSPGTLQRMSLLPVVTVLSVMPYHAPASANDSTRSGEPQVPDLEHIKDLNSGAQLAGCYFFSGLIQQPDSNVQV